MIKINRIKNKNYKADITNYILRELDEWFSIEESIVDYVSGVENTEFYVAYDEDEPIGFISVKKHNEYTAEIYVLGVLKEYHGMGIGKDLVQKAEDYVIKEQGKLLMLKTLGESHPDVNYARTRNFYLKNGFLPLEELDEIWEENPCLIMVKTIENNEEEKNKFKIIPLNKEHLNQAIKLVKSVFKYEEESVKRELQASVDERKFIRYVASEDNTIETLEYFIAIDDNKKVLGIIGLYSTKEDANDTYWIGWYCVNPRERGKGIGIKLLNYVTNEARNRGKKYLSLYTSDYKKESKAQELYERNEFYITKKIYRRGNQILYRRKEL